MLILCMVFFLLPFVLRGAREAIDSMKNDVADWLPKSFVETKELGKFRDYFIGDQFVVVSWEGCTERDGRFQLLVQKIKQESSRNDDLLAKRLATMDPASAEYSLLSEELEAREWANEIGLHTTGDYYEAWGEHNEKWLLGKNKQWYFIRQDGSVFKWDGQNNLIHATGRALQRFFKGKNQADGKFVKRFGSAVNNRFYNDPTLMSARFFNDVTTGPDIFKRFAGEGGTQRIGQWKQGAEVFNAEIESHKRLTGVLFGPTPPPEFDWTLNSFLSVIPDEERKLIDDERKFEYQNFLKKLKDSLYDGDINKLRAASQSDQLEHWYRLWKALQIEAPPRQTCLFITLNDPVLDELARVVGRPVLGKPRGRILELATGQCGIKPNNLHIGGPPVDNVAIDEEGSITLFRLVGLSAIIGLSLAYLSFRSIRVTLMLFFVGGVSAIASLAFVWFGGSTMDAILMTMPSLVYVLGLSGAVHVVNYYRDACEEDGEANAAETAVKHGLFPCSLAAFTTALGLFSLYTSNLTPIKKFGLFSAIATLATVVLLFTYLPSSLTIWSPGYKQRNRNDGNKKRSFSLARAVESFWDAVGRWVVANYKIVMTVSIVCVAVFAYGITKIQTNVQLLKLFRSDAKILRDYSWMEENLGKLVPMELVIEVDADSQIQPDLISPDDSIAKRMETELKLSLLQRMELSDRVRRNVLKVFGDESPVEEKRCVGNSMSTDVATPLDRVVDSQDKGKTSRIAAQADLQENYAALLEQDYLRLDPDSKEEMWRISLRLAALNDVDYGQFVSDLKTVVEPILSAYRYRSQILKDIHALLPENALKDGRVLIIGTAPPRVKKDDLPENQAVASDGSINQTYIFAETLHDLLRNAGFSRLPVPPKPRTEAPDNKRGFFAYDPAARKTQFDDATWKQALERFDIVVAIEDPALIDLDMIRANSLQFIDARDHRYEIDKSTKTPLAGMLTAAERRAEGDENALISTTYTGIVPIVYKAQRALLSSLIRSICLAFVMIAIVMMILLRSWGSPVTLANSLNVRAGMLSMLPNVFPVVLIFGAMGYMRRDVDIGSMMTASVAMGVAVDDTIHFLNWFRQGIGRGLDRLAAIRLAYKKVATAMTQTTLIGGFGLSAFAFSTFMPTQRFGILMLFLLVAALIGDLVFLPAILASPLGKYFANVNRKVDSHEDLGRDDHGDLHDMDDADPDHKPGDGNLSVKHPILTRDRPGQVG